MRLTAGVLLVVALTSACGGSSAPSRSYADVEAEVEDLYDKFEKSNAAIGDDDTPDEDWKRELGIQSTILSDIADLLEDVTTAGAAEAASAARDASAAARELAPSCDGDHNSECQRGINKVAEAYIAAGVALESAEANGDREPASTSASKAASRVQSQGDAIDDDAIEAMSQAVDNIDQILTLLDSPNAATGPTLGEGLNGLLTQVVTVQSSIKKMPSLDEPGAGAYERTLAATEDSIDLLASAEAACIEANNGSACVEPAQGAVDSVIHLAGLISELLEAA